jgi:acetyl coenzyme A synthetase (ADP forming)-like protein
MSPPAKTRPAPKRPKSAMPRASRTASKSLDAILRPRSVAVVGASRRRQTIGHEILHNLVDFGFVGPVYPVNPGVESVRSIKAYKSLLDIPGPVDLAVIVVPRDSVLKVVEQCGKKGVRGLVVISAGFREIGVDGVRLEEKLARKVRNYGMRMVGPNCMGVINTESSVQLNATFASALAERGNVGFVSQSGALGEAILADAMQWGIGVAMFVSVGNKADVSANDLLEYWEDNDDIQAILLYLESFGNPRKFTQIARRITRKKPIIAVKAGRTAAGARAASSHTGSIVGLDIATDSLLEQCGVLRVGTMGELFVKAAALTNQPIPKGDRVAIVTNAGGPGILCTDACIGRGLPLADFSSATQRALKRILPAEASIANPVDMIASADATAYRAVLERVRKDPGVDGIISIFVSPITIDAFEVARAIAEAADGTKPMLSVFMGKQRSAEGIEELRRNRVPVYRFPGEAASAWSALCRYRALRDRPQGKIPHYTVHRRRAQRAIETARRDGRTALSADEVQRVLEAYGLRMAPSRLARSSAEAIAAAQELGYPVVLKIASSRILHKTDVGGVRVDLRNADEVGTSFREMTKKLIKQDPELSVQVQGMVSGGREVILGMKRDPQFGPLMMFGLGGIFVEALQDVAVRVHPLTDAGARSMIEGIRAYPVLAGMRGEKPVALPLIEESLLRLSQLVSDFEDDLEEFDLNPLIVTHARDQSFVVDARMLLRE